MNKIIALNSARFSWWGPGSQLVGACGPAFFPSPPEIEFGAF